MSRPKDWISPTALPKTGWPPGLLQDDNLGFFRWLANKPEARRLVRENIEDLRKKDERHDCRA